MTEVEKLEKWEKETGAIIRGVTTSYSMGISDRPPTEEEIAREINRVNEYLSDPINSLISKIEGNMHLMSDTINCLTNRKRITADGLIDCPPNDEEKSLISSHKECIELFTEAVRVIKELKQERANRGLPWLNL